MNNNQDNEIRELRFEDIDISKLTGTGPIHAESIPWYAPTDVMEQWAERGGPVVVQLVVHAEAIRAKLLGADSIGVVLAVEQSTKLVPWSAIVSISLAD